MLLTDILARIRQHLNGPSSKWSCVHTDDLAALIAVAEAAREYAAAVVKAWTSDNQDNIWTQEWRDAQVNMDEKQSALLAAVGGGAADAAKP